MHGQFGRCLQTSRQHICARYLCAIIFLLTTRYLKEARHRYQTSSMVCKG